MAGVDEVMQTYRAGQLATRADALRQIGGLWRAVSVTSLSTTIGAFSAAAAALVLGGWGDAALGTVDFLADLRDAEEVPGRAPRYRPAPPVPAAEAAGLIRGAAITGIVNARRSGANERRAKDNGLVKVLGEAGKLVMNGGRETVILGVRDDPRAAGYGRFVSAGACDWCRMLAGRGAVYLSAKSVDFRSHGHCACVGRPVFD